MFERTRISVFAAAGRTRPLPRLAPRGRAPAPVRRLAAADHIRTTAGGAQTSAHQRRRRRRPLAGVGGGGSGGGDDDDGALFEAALI